MGFNFMSGVRIGGLDELSRSGLDRAGMVLAKGWA
jgi:hypothetical protein